MGEIRCVIPLQVRLRGIPGDRLLQQMRAEIARALAARLRTADRQIAAREGALPCARHAAAPCIRFGGMPTDDAARRRIAAAIEAAITEALAGGMPSPTSVRQVDWHPGNAAGGALADDGLHLRAGSEDVFWNALRTALASDDTAAPGSIGRREAVRVLLQGVRRPRAQALIREALERPGNAGRYLLVEALGAATHDQPLAWRLLLGALSRPGDTLGLAAFDAALARDADLALAFLADALGSADAALQRSAGRVVRHALDARSAGARPRAPARALRGRLRALARRFGLYADGPPGADALREQVVRRIDVLVETLPAIVAPLDPPVRLETADSDDSHTLAATRGLLLALAAGTMLLDWPALRTLARRVDLALAMAALLPQRIGLLQRKLAALAAAQPDESLPHDEVVVLHRLRRAYLLAFATAATDDGAHAAFLDAEKTLATLAGVVADLKFARLEALFEQSRVDVALCRSRAFDGIEADAAAAEMWRTLHLDGKSFVNVFARPPYAGPPDPSAGPVHQLDMTLQLEADLDVYRVQGAMFAMYTAALQLEDAALGRFGGQALGDEDWRRATTAALRPVRTRILGYWHRGDFAGFLGVAEHLNRQLAVLESDVAFTRRRDGRVRTLITLAAALVAGIATAASGGLLAPSLEGVALLAAEAVVGGTAFTLTDQALERFTFDTPLSARRVGREWASNIGQMFVLGAVFKAIGPLGGRAGGWMGFVRRQAVGLAVQASLVALPSLPALRLALETRRFTPETQDLLVQALGMYVIGLVTSSIGHEVKQAALRSRQAEVARRGADVRQRVDNAARSGLFGVAELERLKADLRLLLDGVEECNRLLAAADAMTASEQEAAQDLLDTARARVDAMQAAGAGAVRGPLTLDPDQVQGLTRVGDSPIYHYDPASPPAQLADLDRSLRLVPGLDVQFEGGLLVARDATTRELRLLVGPGEGPVAFLSPPRRALAAGSGIDELPTFLEAAAGTGPLAPQRRQLLAREMHAINRNAVAILESLGDTGLAALSLLAEHRAALQGWSDKAIRGLATALELPRAIRRSTLGRFFARSNSELVKFFEDFSAIAGMPGANAVFRQPSTIRTIYLVELYRELRARGFELPPGMDESAQRGLMFMAADLGRPAMIDRLRQVDVAARLSEFRQRDPLADAAQPPPTLEAQAVLDRHALDLRPGINLLDPALTSAQVVARIAKRASAFGGSFDADYGYQLAERIDRYRKWIRGFQDETGPNARNVNGALREFQDVMETLERGDSPHEVRSGTISLGRWKLLGRVTIVGAPEDLIHSPDRVSTSAAGVLELAEIGDSDLGLPSELQALARTDGDVTIDFSKIPDDTSSGRKWRQILKNQALVEFAHALGGGPARTTVHVRSATKPAREALRRMGIHLQVDTPSPP